MHSDSDFKQTKAHSIWVHFITSLHHEETALLYKAFVSTNKQDTFFDCLHIFYIIKFFSHTTNAKNYNQDAAKKCDRSTDSAVLWYSKNILWILT